MARYMLTVAIPTFNREKPLEHTLSVILPQVLAHEDVQLLVLDNASEVPAEQVLQRVAGGLVLPDRVRAIRHPANIGGNANILRCFEVAEGDWLWCLGDDDEPSRQAVETVLSHLNPDYAFLYFSIRPGVPQIKEHEPESIAISTLEEWAFRIPSLGHRYFISTTVFNLGSCLPNLRFGYSVLASGGPHLFLAFLAVVAGKKALVSKTSIVEYVLPGTGWNCVPIVLGMAELFAFAKTGMQLRSMKRFFADPFFFWISPSLFLYQLVLQYPGATGLEIGNRFGRTISLLMPSCKHVKKFLECWGCRLLAYVPHVFLALVRWRERRIGYHYDLGGVRDV